MAGGLWWPVAGGQDSGGMRLVRQEPPRSCRPGALAALTARTHRHPALWSTLHTASICPAHRAHTGEECEASSGHRSHWPPPPTIQPLHRGRGAREVEKALGEGGGMRMWRRRRRRCNPLLPGGMCRPAGWRPRQLSRKAERRRSVPPCRRQYLAGPPASCCLHAHQGSTDQHQPSSTLAHCLGMG